jgi:hypothetical protein
MKFSKVFFFILVLLLSACRDKKTNNPDNTTPTEITPSTNVKGYGLFNYINGIWTGSVVSSTSLGNFPDYTADYRPISAAQVSAKNELDKNNDLFMSFFIVWHCDQYKLAFRNGGFFSGMKRISYLVIDSVSENSGSSFYRFTDFKAGKTRSYADLLFKNDSLYMKVYTNKSNSLPQAVIHFAWDAGKQDATAAQPAISHFSFPKKEMVKDFCKSFDGRPESIYYDSSQDVYTEAQQPYVGKTTVNVSLNGLPTAGKKVFLIVTTQPLFNGFSPQLQNLKYKSRYVIMDAASPSFDFNYMHPGSYYVYGLYDADGNNTFSSGDYIALSGTSPNNAFTVAEREQKTMNLNLNFQIP